MSIDLISVGRQALFVFLAPEGDRVRAPRRVIKRNIKKNLDYT
jgi:hypothetical protein